MKFQWRLPPSISSFSSSKLEQVVNINVSQLVNELLRYWVSSARLCQSLSCFVSRKTNRKALPFPTLDSESLWLKRHEGKVTTYISLAKANMLNDLQWRFVNQIHVFTFKSRTWFYCRVLFRFVSLGKFEACTLHDVGKSIRSCFQLLSCFLFNEISNRIFFCFVSFDRNFILTLRGKAKSILDRVDCGM